MNSITNSEVNTNDTPTKPTAPPFPLVGLGASAGGIQALQTFFETMSTETGMAFVVIMHLSPHHESNLAQILQMRTVMPVLQITGRTPVLPNHIYVIPPNKHLALQDGHINLIEPQQTVGKRLAVDLFFRTLAAVYGTRAIAIVLSGTDSDGAIGIKHVKEQGGITIAQEPTEAEFDGWQNRRAQQSRERRLARWQHVRDLSAQGHTQQQIAGKIGLSEKTVRGYLRATTFPERRIYPCPAGKRDVHHAYLRNRWEHGCHNALQLWRELKYQGHSVSATMVRDYVRAWRALPTAPPPQPNRLLVPSVRALTWLLIPQRRHTPEQVQMRQTLLEASPTLQQSQHLVQGFRTLLRRQSVADLASWMERVVCRGLTPLVSFVRGLEADRSAVEAAVTQRGNNGPTEGQVNRLKFIKRQGYGRAGFALLKARTLPMAA